MAETKATKAEPNLAKLQGSLTAAQRKAKEASVTIKKQKNALKRALAALDAAKVAAGITVNSEDAGGDVAPAPPASKKSCDAGHPQFSPKDLARFELNEAEKEYKGDPEDRKAMLEHRQKMQSKVREIEKAKEAFIKAETAKYEKEKNTKREKEGAVRKAEREVEFVKEELAAAEKKAETIGKKVNELTALVKKHGGKVEDKKMEPKKQAQPIIRPFKPMDDNELDIFLASAAATAATASAAAAGKDKKASSSAPGVSQEIPLRPDVYSPEWLSVEHAARLATTLYVSDILNQFGRSLGLGKPLQFTDFEKALDAASNALPEEKKQQQKKKKGRQENKGSNNDDENDDIEAIVQTRSSVLYKGPASPLHDVYYNIMRILIEDMRGRHGTNASINRRLALITPGSWPEVLRRDVLASTTGVYVAEFDRPEEHVVDAANALAYDGADGLNADQHLSLLHYLADEVMQTEHLRSVLQKREEEAADLKRDVREDIAEERRKLKELTEAEKEVLNNTKKRKFETSGASASVGGPSRQLSLDTPELPDDVQSNGNKSNDTEEEEEEEIPSFELPKNLREYKGDPKDKTALEAFGLKQAAAQRKLDTKRTKWLAERERLQLEKAEKAMEKLAAKKEATEEALVKAQEALEERIEKLAVRRIPIGSDRHHRRYWILPKRAAVYVEDEESGLWGVVSTVAQLDELIKSLDKRGLRELALRRVLEKKYDSLVLAMRRAENLKNTNGTASTTGANGDGTDGISGKQEQDGKMKKKEKVAVEPLRQSSRERRQAEFFDPSTGKAIIRSQQQNQSGGDKDGQSAADYATQHAKHKSLAPYFGPSERIAFFEAVDILLELRRDAAELCIEGPNSEGSWKEWLREVDAAAQGKTLVNDEKNKNGTGPAPNASFLLGLLQGKAFELENAIYNAGDNPETSDEEDGQNDNEEEEEEEEEQGGPRRSRRNMKSDDSENEDATKEDGENAGGEEEQGLLVDFIPENFSPVKQGSNFVTTKLWKSGEWRQQWLLDLRQGSSNARLVYCLGILKQHSDALFRFLSGKEEEEEGAKDEPVPASATTGAATGGGALGKPPLPPGAMKEISRKRRMQEKERDDTRRATRSRV